MQTSIADSVDKCVGILGEMEGANLGVRFFTAEFGTARGICSSMLYTCVMFNIHTGLYVAMLYFSIAFAYIIPLACDIT